jgi:hypothetical protein
VSKRKAEAEKITITGIAEAACVRLKPFIGQAYLMGRANGLDEGRWYYAPRAKALAKALEKEMWLLKVQGCTCSRSWPRAGNHEKNCMSELYKRLNAALDAWKKAQTV